MNLIVDGGWSDWENSTCSVSCGRGRVQRIRTCTNPPPSHGGNTCQGQASDYFMCQLPKCPGKTSTSVNIITEVRVGASGLKQCAVVGLKTSKDASIYFI